MNTQLHELRRLLAAIDSCMGSVEVQGLIRDARRDAGQARGYAAKAIKIVAALDAQAGQVPQAMLDVHAERRRQVEAEGFDASHDDMATKGQIARAAGCYALHAAGVGTNWPDGIGNGSALFWPWDKEWWKPKPPRENLVRAGAMIIAEIERLDRAAGPAQGGE